MVGVIAIFLLSITLSRPDSLPASPQPFVDALRLSGLGKHQAAESLARSWNQAAQPEGKVLQAVIGLSWFADLHDLAALERARKALAEATTALEDKTSPPHRVLLAQALSQTAFLAGLEGRNLAAALAGRRAANLCEALMTEGYDSPDLRGILGSYQFWKAQSLGALRLAVGDTRAQGLEWTRQAASTIGPFQEAYRTSLMWIRFERKEFAQGLALARAGLAAVPGNRLYHQAEGDMLFRLDRFSEALAVYRASWAEYAGLERLPVNRLAAAGNLARIHDALGQRDSARAWLDTLDAPRYQAVSRWLPPSLVRELAPIRKRLAP